MRLTRSYLSPVIIAIGLGLAGCGGGEKVAGPDASDRVGRIEAPATPMITPWGYPLDAFDRATRPGDDFFRFANGGWLDATPIPDERSGTGFSIIMQERNEARMAEIISSLQADNPAMGSNAQKIRDLYESFMDEAAIEAADMAPFAGDLARLAGIETHEDVARAMADAELSIGSIFGIGVAVDSKAPTEYAVYAGQAGLGLPDRTYYLLPGEKLSQQRAAYQDYMAEVFTLLSEPRANERAQSLMQLETKLAELHWSRADRRDATRTYNPTDLSQLEATAGGFPWRTYMAAIGLGQTETLILREADTFAPVAALFAETSVETWRNYLLFHYISANADYMPKRFSDADFDFYGRTLSGQKEQRPRDKRAIGLVDGFLNQAVGQIYIARFFPEESKRQMTQMFENIRAAFAMRIDGLDWMTEETKIAAQAKLAAMTGKIAYPDTWRTYDDVMIARDDLFGNIRSARAANQAFNNARLGTKVDKSEWITGPQTVNAFYSPNRNEVFIPAGYIQSPLFDPAADPAINYGAIGSIIGHEIGHGFDDQGSRYDGDGTLQSWWTDADRAAFDALGDRLAAQFDQYEPLPGLNVNGRQTLGENIGDLAGVTVAYHAYLLSLKGAQPPVLDGFTGAQRVFLGRAQGRRFKQTDESMRQRLLSAPHSPMNLRVNGMIRNMDEWYDAFDVKEGDALYLAPEDRVKIW